MKITEKRTHVYEDVVGRTCDGCGTRTPAPWPQDWARVRLGSGDHRTKDVCGVPCLIKVTAKAIQEHENLNASIRDGVRKAAPWPFEYSIENVSFRFAKDIARLG